MNGWDGRTDKRSVVIENIDLKNHVNKTREEADIELFITLVPEVL